MGRFISEETKISITAHLVVWYKFLKFIFKISLFISPTVIIIYSMYIKNVTRPDMYFCAAVTSITFTIGIFSSYQDEYGYQKKRIANEKKLLEYQMSQESKGAITPVNDDKTS